MVEIVFEPHATTFDNEQALASGWNDVALSQAGEAQAKELGERRRDEHFDAIFCSDTERAWQTVTLAFGSGLHKIYVDWRLRECDYGDFTLRDKDEVDAEKLKRIEEPFPNGESYAQCVERMGSFIADLKQRWDGKRVLIIGHRATHYALDHLIKGMPLEECVAQKFAWQPGWTYELS